MMEMTYLLRPPTLLRYRIIGVVSLSLSSSLQTRLVCEIRNGYGSFVAYTENTCSSTSMGLQGMIDDIRIMIEEVKTEIDVNEAKIDQIIGPGRVVTEGKTIISRF